MALVTMAAMNFYPSQDVLFVFIIILLKRITENCEKVALQYFITSYSSWLGRGKVGRLPIAQQDDKN